MSALLPHQQATLQALLANQVFARAAEEKNWLVYELRQRPGKKPAKIPVTCSPARRSVPKDAAAQWTLNEVLDQLAEGYGIGYLPRKGSALVGVDIDKCVVNGDDIEQWALDMIGLSYAEFSPSGTGLRVLLPRRNGDDWFREPGGANPLGFFGSEGRFFTVTFDCIDEVCDGLVNDPTMRASIKKHLGTVTENKRAKALATVSKNVKRGNDRKHWFFQLEEQEQMGCMAEVLGFFDPAPDETWHRVGMALKTLDVPWAWDLFDAWSQDAEAHYDREENKKRWRSFKADGDLTFRTLFKEAADAGWNESAWREPVTFEPIEVDGLFAGLNDDDEPQAPWLMEHFLRERGSAGLVGMSNLGKTILAAGWCAGMISGNTEAVGLPPIAGPVSVLWMNAEEERASMRGHVKAALHEFGLKPVADLQMVGVEALSATNDGISLVVHKFNEETRRTELVINEPLVAAIIAKCKEIGAKVLILDPYTEFNDGEENHRGDAKKLHRALTRISQEAGVATIYWSHTGQPPEGKRTDWYRDDIFSQRGSSQNVGSLKTMGTLTPMYPSYLRGKEAGNTAKTWEWWERSKSRSNTDVPNLVRLKLLKVKQSPELLSWAYEIKTSKMSDDFPVAYPMSVKAAEMLLDGSHGSAESLVTTRLTRRMVEALGEGRHTANALRQAMKGADGWLADVRIGKGKSDELLSRWSEPQLVRIDDQDWEVQIIVEAKENRFETVITKV